MEAVSAFSAESRERSRWLSSSSRGLNTSSVFNERTVSVRYKRPQDYRWDRHQFNDADPLLHTCTSLVLFPVPSHSSASPVSLHLHLMSSLVQSVFNSTLTWLHSTSSVLFPLFLLLLWFILNNKTSLIDLPAPAWRTVQCRIVNEALNSFRGAKTSKERPSFN